MKRIITILALSTLTLIAAGCTTRTATNDSLYSNKSGPTKTLEANQPLVESFTIEPSKKQDGWILYADGAKAVLKAENISSAELRYIPTGTGAGLKYPQGIVLGKFQKSSDGIYMITLPKGLMVTNFWAAITDINGKVVKGPDLGNVAEDPAK